MDKYNAEFLDSCLCLKKIWPKDWHQPRLLQSSYDSAYVDQWHLDNAGGLETSWHHDSSEPALMFFIEHVNSWTVNL